MKHLWSLNGRFVKWAVLKSEWSLELTFRTSKWTTVRFDPLDRPVQVPIPRLLLSEDVLEDRHPKRTSSFVPLGRPACSKDHPVFAFLDRMLSQKVQSFELVAQKDRLLLPRAVFIRFDLLV